MGRGPTTAARRDAELEARIVAIWTGSGETPSPPGRSPLPKSGREERGEDRPRNPPSVKAGQLQGGIRSELGAQGHPSNPCSSSGGTAPITLSKGSMAISSREPKYSRARPSVSHF